MVHGPDQRATGQALHADVPEPVHVGPDTDVLRLPEQEQAVRGGDGRETPARDRLQQPGHVQLERGSRADEPRLVPRRHRSHMSHHAGDIPAAGLYTAHRHRYYDVDIRDR